MRAALTPGYADRRNAGVMFLSNTSNTLVSVQLWIRRTGRADLVENSCIGPVVQDPLYGAVPPRKPAGTITTRSMECPTYLSLPLRSYALERDAPNPAKIGLGCSKRWSHHQDNFNHPAVRGW